MTTAPHTATPEIAAPWMQMASGRAWSLLQPAPEHVHWPDFAESLAKICRFNGHCTHFYSVAQHCCHVADILPPNLRLRGLLHDAHEAVTGDTIYPVKMALKVLNEADMAAYMEYVNTCAIYTAAGEPIDDHQGDRIVKQADLVMLATERRDVMAPAHLPWDALPDPAPMRIKPWPWPKAMEEWLDRLNRYLPHDKRGG
jgi:hypothetical protein